MEDARDRTHVGWQRVMDGMASRRELAIVVLIVAVLSSSLCSTALGNDKLDWGVERIRAYWSGTTTTGT
jgi:hypothetical protein